RRRTLAVTEHLHHRLLHRIERVVAMAQAEFGETEGARPDAGQELFQRFRPDRDGGQWTDIGCRRDLRQRNELLAGIGLHGCLPSLLRPVMTIRAPVEAIAAPVPARLGMLAATVQPRIDAVAL